jgi:hypothetical protein
MKRTKPKPQIPPPPIVRPDADVLELQEIANELEQKRPLELTLRPSTAFQLCALIQLALRHPGPSESIRTVGTKFCVAVRTHFDGAPTVQAVIDKGFQPEHDQ